VPLSRVAEVADKDLDLGSTSALDSKANSIDRRRRRRTPSRMLPAAEPCSLSDMRVAPSIVPAARRSLSEHGRAFLTRDELNRTSQEQDELARGDAARRTQQSPSMERTLVPLHVSRHRPGSGPVQKFLLSNRS
jgi:hypothetical protein